MWNSSKNYHKQCRCDTRFLVKRNFNGLDGIHFHWSRSVCNLYALIIINTLKIIVHQQRNLTQFRIFIDSPDAHKIIQEYTHTHGTIWIRSFRRLCIFFPRNPVRGNVISEKNIPAREGIRRVRHLEVKFPFSRNLWSWNVINVTAIKENTCVFSVHAIFKCTARAWCVWEMYFLLDLNCELQRSYFMPHVIKSCTIFHWIVAHVAVFDCLHLTVVWYCYRLTYGGGFGGNWNFSFRASRLALWNYIWASDPNTLILNEKRNNIASE